MLVFSELVAVFIKLITYFIKSISSNIYKYQAKSPDTPIRNKKLSSISVSYYKISGLSPPNYLVITIHMTMTSQATGTLTSTKHKYTTKILAQ